MGDDFISQQMRRTNRNLLIIGTIVGFTWRDVYNHLLGPFPAQPAELASIWNPDVPQRYYLQVQGEKPFATGVQEVQAGHPGRVRAEVVVLVVGQGLLVVKQRGRSQCLPPVSWLSFPVPVQKLFAEGNLLEFADRSARQGIEENKGIRNLPLRKGLS